jgi:TRAP-type uncharacterized transport system substrate-binding protein
MNKKTLLVLLINLLLCLGGTVQAADPNPTLVISTGKSGGGYNAVGERLKTVMAEQEIPVQVLTSVGSTENLNRLNDPASPVNLALTQADALKYYLGEHPEFVNKLFILGDVGMECVFIVTGKDSGIDSDTDLEQKKGNLLALQDPNSGSAVTYLYMNQLQPKFKNTPAAFVDTLEALLQIKNGNKQSKVNAVMFVQRPTAGSPEMQVVLDDPRNFHFIAVTDSRLDDKLPDGKPVYTFEKVTVQEKKWGFDTKVNTICTQGLLIGSKDKLNAELRSRLAKVMLLSGSRVLEGQ